MSTWLYVQCLAHDPVITAAEESGQHLSDLKHIREDIANRNELLSVDLDSSGWRLPDIHGDSDDYWAWYFRRYFSRATIAFMQAHPKCPLGIQDEYGRDYPLTAKDGAA